MPRINVLDKKTAELIAAGEVIERPSSVVKELVENSIDAGATSVTIEIKNGGVRLIRITDNGCGIDREDIPKAFLRHATSKVSGEDDLYRIATLGFRGEALASVCAVSRVEMLSRTPECELGYSYCVDGGDEIGAPAQAGCPQGTTIYVRDLFYNIPARMKFLKKDVTEGNAIATLLDRLALSHPEVSFRFIREGSRKLQTPGDGKLLSAIYAVYGREFGASLIPVNSGTGTVQISGFISKPESAKATRTMQHFFINERYVRSVTAMAALEESYKNGIMVGRYPGCVLHIKLPWQNVDVNVHPAKLEVKLTDERSVFDAVYSGCRGALENMGQAVAVVDTASRSVKDKLSYFDLTNKPLEGQQQHMTSGQYRSHIASAPNLPKKPPQTVSMRDNSALKLYMEQLKRSSAAQEPIISLPVPTAAFSTKPAPAVELSKPLSEPPPFKEQVPVDLQAQTQQEPVSQSEPQPEPMLLIGEVFSTYIMAQQGDKLILVDKHAAHERILFNKLREEYRLGSVSRQLMLSSIRLSFSKDIYSALTGSMESLERLGFLAEDFGNGSILVREIPSMMELDVLEDTILEVGEKLMTGCARPELDRTDDLLHSIACKAAIKGGYFTGEIEQKKLLELLENDSTLRSCPHGRPIIVAFTRRELEKMFGRIV